MDMQCFARWNEDEQSGLCFRDQTILQFGDSWDLLSSFILLNPGSAVPKDMEPQDRFLTSKKLPYLVLAKDNHYYRFTIDRLMNDLLRLYTPAYVGGVIKIYNLFNLKNQDSGNAIEQFMVHRNHASMFTHQEDVCYCGKPVIIATGGNAYADEALTTELKKYIALVNRDQLYALTKVDDRQFEILKAEPDECGLIDGYHPSYTFKYGNQTSFATADNGG